MELRSGAVPPWPEMASIVDISHVEYLRALPEAEYSSDFNWLSLRAWCPSAQVARLRETLIVRFPKYHDPAEFILGFTGGTDPDAVVKELLSMEAFDLDDIGLIPESTARRVTGWDIVEDRDNWDYLYSIRSMIDLPGKGNRANRWRRNKFRSLHGDRARIWTASPNHVEWASILSLAQKWAAAYRSVTDAQDELDAVKRCEEAIRCIGSPTIIVTTLHVGEALIGFDISEVLATGSSGRALQHFTHVDHEFEGAREELRTAVAVHLEALGVKTFNAEQDLGVDGLRNRKVNDGPDGFIVKFGLRQLFDCDASVGLLASD